jgi:hypothetical protein
MADVQVADAPRTLPLAVPYTHFQTAIGLGHVIHHLSFVIGQVIRKVMTNDK